MTDVLGRNAHDQPAERHPSPSSFADGVVIRECTMLEEYLECVSIQEETWGRGFSERVPAAILRVSQRVGGITAAAFDARGHMLGFVFGMTGVKDGEIVHWSDMLAVRPEARGRRLGERLKQYQRQRVCALGARRMMWTFDPLVSRNAHFNINRLGAYPVEYAVNMYGTTRSELHGTLPTDRFIVAWNCQDDSPTRSSDRDAEQSEIIPLLNPVSNGTPSLETASEASRVRVQVPIDVQPIIQKQPALATRWREITRKAFGERLAAGYRVTGFVRASEDGADRNGELPYYILTRSSQR